MLRFGVKRILAATDTAQFREYLRRRSVERTRNDLPDWGKSMQTHRNRSERFRWLPACGRCFGRAACASLVLALLFAAVLRAVAANEPSAADETDTHTGTRTDTPTPVAANEPSAVDEPVIPAGQDDLLAGMLGRGAALPEQCKFAGGEVDHAVIKATYACPGGEVVFELRHPSKAPAGATETARFAITLLSGSPPAGLAEALTSRIRSGETAFEWRLPQSRPKPRLVLFAAAGILGIAVVLGWALWRRKSARPTQLP